MARPLHIGIAGGGIAGLTAALACARNGIRVTILEQAEELQEIGAGLQISPNAWQVFDLLGLAPSVIAVSVAPAALRIRSGRDGRTIARMPLGGAAEARWGAPYRVAHRADLQKVLAESVASAGAELRLGARLSGISRSASAVEVALESGGQAAFDGLVGADGLWSIVRHHVIGEAPPRFSGKVAWRTTLAADELPMALDLKETELWLGRDAHLVHYGVRGGKEVNIIAVTTSRWQAPGWSAPGNREEIAAAFADWPAPAREVIAAAREWRRWALADRPPDKRWGSGPVTLAGDAAHPMLPFLAQGAAMGIEDGWVLAASLAGAEEAAAGFRRYEIRRMGRTERVQRAARTNGDIYHLGGLAARGRDLALSLMGTEQLMARWDWLYGWRPGAS